ncbi:MAG TPA: carboxymuconolactone decarboxylase family protein [Puia sp.]|nr:carboxymuconolactone decarboxylase family protein [Puia sp.]
MKGFSIPRRTDVTPGNKVIFDQLTSILGTVPNLYAGFAWSANALSTYLALENGKSSLNARQREVIHLIVSQVNDCKYCLTAHSEIARMNGFTEEQIREIRSGTATFDIQLDAIVKLAKNITENRGRSDEAALNDFFSAGLSNENLVDLILVIGYMIIANYLQALINTPLDFPLTADWEDSI